MKIYGNRIYLRHLEERDAAALLDLNVRNREFFQKFSPIRDADFYTLEGQRDQIKRYKSRQNDDYGYAWGIFLRSNDELIGNVALMEILRGALQSCFIGYSLDQRYNGQGYMTEAVRLATKYAFETLKLHRIEAGVMPHNFGSIRVLEKAGYHKEGIARKNVKINGRWEDHQVLAIINENDYIRD
jgi:ribosomal-protein-alanine N-acetyltransferase